jgi:mono/diheme cytochrome c family protein
MERALAEAVARDQGAALSVHEFDGSGDDEGFDMQNFSQMLAEQCQLVLGFPLRGREGLPDGLQATQAYARTGFVLVTPAAHAVSSLAALPAGTQVAVAYQTTANLFFEQHPGLQAAVRLSDEQALDALQRGQVRAALLWRPTLARYLAQSHANPHLHYVALDEPRARYGLVALYTEPQAAIARRFEASVEHLQQRAQLAALLSPYAEVEGAVAAVGSKSDTALAATATATAVAATNPAPKSVDRPALYTSAQADNGKSLYAEQCALCHGETLSGRAGPALKGVHFAPDSGRYKVGDIFTIVSQNMPATQPGSLPHETYVDIMAFLLQQNGYPAGDKPLSFDDAKASKVPVIYSSL